MMRFMKRRLYIHGAVIFVVLAAIVLSAASVGICYSSVFSSLNLKSASAILVEASSGDVLYAKEADKELPPASISKVMTMLLIMEAIDSGKIKYTDKVIASEYACSKGGSQIYLEPGEEMTVEELLKSVAVASANDACVALAEYVGGTEDGFVAMMNKRAKKLGLKHTHFVNTNGLPPDNPSDIGNYSSARDLAIMSKELITHTSIHKFLTIWMDTVRGGQFGLTNTNKLVRFYRGADGVKTGYTEKARHCLSATAQRDGVRMIAVVMGAPDSQTRFNEASKLMDIGFAQFRSLPIVVRDEKISTINVLKGLTNKVTAVASNDLSAVIRRDQNDKFEKKIKVADELTAPIKKGQKIGELVAFKDGKIIGKVDIVASKNVKKAGLIKVIGDTFKSIVRVPFRVKAK